MGISSNLQGLMDAQSPGTQSRGVFFSPNFLAFGFWGIANKRQKERCVLFMFYFFLMVNCMILF